MSNTRAEIESQLDQRHAGSNIIQLAVLQQDDEDCGLKIP